jgi:CheY-like chemotaxis protein
MQKETANRIVLAVVEDMFFASKIESAARHAGLTLIQVRDEAALSLQLDTIVPDLVVIDLSGKAVGSLAAIRRIKSDDRYRGTEIVGFFSHVQLDLEEAAREAGCDQVVPRSAFSRNLSAILGSGKEE